MANPPVVRMVSLPDAIRQAVEPGEAVTLGQLQDRIEPRQEKTALWYWLNRLPEFTRDAKARGRYRRRAARGGA